MQNWHCMYNYMQSRDQNVNWVTVKKVRIYIILCMCIHTLNKVYCISVLWSFTDDAVHFFLTSNSYHYTFDEKLDDLGKQKNAILWHFWYDRESCSEELVCSEVHRPRWIIHDTNRGKQETHSNLYIQS